MKAVQCSRVAAPSPKAMAGKITKILLVLAILQYGLRADAQAVKVMEKVLTQHEEQCNQEMTWLAMAESITEVLMVAGIFQYALSVDLPALKVTEELLKQHEEQHSQEMAKLEKMEQRMQEQSRPTQERVLCSVCQQWWFWNCAEIILMLFGIYWLPIQKRAGSGSGSQEKTTCSAQEQMEEDKPLDKSWTLGKIC
ncbi:uncharacterized protein LOC128804237 isoform X2 [Vidua macroura]|uniref:uncharacterized protein LOC128804237 isoform X2 n=1 Tax=Vidua macroura TaxID=187451 RepID=UPI0023A8FAC7|nr:uncharacterized protein LOC128804237 isoform X2 [Vidua macroura]